MNFIMTTLLRHLGVDEDYLSQEEVWEKEKQLQFSDISKSFKTPEETPLSSGRTDTKENKKVCFNQKIKVILVPTASEYIQAGCDLWWSQDEFDRIRDDFRREVEMALREDPSLENNVYRAMTKLYQPNLESSDECVKRSPSDSDKQAASPADREDVVSPGGTRSQPAKLPIKQSRPLPQPSPSKAMLP